MQHKKNGRVFIFNPIFLNNPEMEEISEQKALAILAGKIPALPKKEKEDILDTMVLPDFDQKDEPAVLSNTEKIKGLLASMEIEEILAYGKKNFALNQNAQQSKEVLIQEIMNVMDSMEQI